MAGARVVDAVHNDHSNVAISDVVGALSKRSIAHEALNLKVLKIVGFRQLEAAAQVAVVDDPYNM